MARHPLSGIVVTATVLLALTYSVTAAPSSEVDDFFDGVRCTPIPEMMPRNGIRDERTRWPNRTVVYQIDRSFSQQDRQVIAQGIQDIERKTCIRFKVRTNERDYVAVGSNRQGCHAAAGRDGGSQVLNLQKPNCVHKGVVAHEFMHSIGIHHEHQRPDRDDFVTIRLENVDRQFRFAFDKMDNRSVSDFGVPYDLKSIMQYPNNAFSNNGKDTIIPKRDPRMRLGQTEGLTPSDARRVNRMYKCPEN